MLTSDVRPSWQKTKKKTEDGGGKKGAQKKKGKKKTAFDRVLESKPRDKFESLEMHLFFFLRVFHRAM